MGDFGPEQMSVYLAGRDVPCPGCGYNLRDLRGSRCPECGDALVLSVGLAEPKQAAGITGLIGLAAGAGLSGLLLVYALIRHFLFGDSFSGEDRFVLITVCGFVVEAAAVWIWLVTWRRIRRLGKGPKLLLVLACWALTFLNILVFSIAIK
jgi:hypothetical protein